VSLPPSLSLSVSPSLPPSLPPPVPAQTAVQPDARVEPAARRSARPWSGTSRSSCDCSRAFFISRSHILRSVTFHTHTHTHTPQFHCASLAQSHTCPLSRSERARPCVCISIAQPVDLFTAHRSLDVHHAWLSRRARTTT
jgi:hypothetical protein